jgi:pimeloyl-ACP methyl ester carboxylesterase
VVLVHGWNSYPGVWSKLVARLEEKSIPAWNFDHSTLRGASVTDIAISLQTYIREMRKKTGWDKNIDLVCHSMGTFAARYFVEVVDGKNWGEKVRQVIGIGPPNNGSALAELFNSPIHGPEIMESLAGRFVSRDFTPAGDTIVQECRPGSRILKRLRKAGMRPDILYRVIIATNKKGNPALFPPLQGKTWEMSADGKWKTTYDGDGIITRAEANLPGAGMDIVPVDAASLEIRPYDYCHIRLPRNAEVIDRIMEYLLDPDTQPQGFCE